MSLFIFTETAESSTASALNTSAASNSASTPTSTSATESTTTGISTPAPTPEATTIATQGIATSGSSGATTTESSIPPSTSISTSTLTSPSAETSTTGTQSTTAAVSSTSTPITPMSTSSVAETATSSSTPAPITESSTITTQVSTVSVSAQTTTSALNSASTPTSTSSTESTTTGISTPAPLIESTTITTQGIAKSEISTTSSSATISASSSTPVSTSSSGVTTTESSTPASTGISMSTLTSPSATSETSTAGSQSTTAAVSSTSTPMSTSPVAETATSISTPAPITESTTIATTQASTISESSTASVQTTSAASNSASTPTSTSATESTSTGISTPAPTTESPTIPTQGTITSEISTTSSSAAISASSPTPVSTRSSGATTTESSTPASTSNSMSTLTSPSATSETLTASPQSTTAAVSSTSTPMSTSPVAKTATSSSTPAPITESSSVTTQASTISAESSTASAQTTSAASNSASTPTSSSATESITPGIATPATTTESTTIPTQGMITNAESSTASEPITSAAPNSASTLTSTSATELTTTGISTPASTTQSTTITTQGITINAETSTAGAQTTTAVTSFAATPTSTGTPGSTTTSSSSPASTAEFMTIATTQGITTGEILNASNSIVIPAPASEATTTTSSAPASTSISTSPLTTTSATSSASVQSITAAVSSTSTTMSTSPVAETTTGSSNPVSITESTTITTQGFATSAEILTASAQTNNAASSSASTIITESTTTGSSSSASITESTTIVSPQATSETSTASAQTTSAAVSSTSTTTSSNPTAQTMTSNSTPTLTAGSTAIATAQAITNAANGTLLASTQTSTAGPTSTSTFASTTGAIITSNFALASTAESVTITTTQFITSESSSSPTPSATETPTLIQTSINTPATGTVTFMTSSEASTTRTTRLLTVEPPIVPVTNNPVQETQTENVNVTFTVLLLPFNSNLQNLTSPSYLNNSSNILDELNKLYTNSKVNSTFLKCRSVSFRPSSDGNSTVEAFCDFTKSASAQQVDRALLYREFQNNTNGITTLGSYSLDSNSLFVNDYHESVVLTTITPTVTTQAPSREEKPIEFNVTFIITNLEFTQPLQDSNSSLYKSVSFGISHQLTDLYNKSKINATFSACKTVSFSPANIGRISVYAICTFRNDSTAPQEVDRVIVYGEFRDNTRSISILRTYSLDNNSLYVNGYHEPAPSSPPFVATSPNLQTKPFDFNVTFIITNLVPTANLLSSSSALSRSASIIIAHQLNNSFMNSNINRTFSGCKVLSFSLANASSTNVYSVCTFGNDSSPQDVNKVTVYREFRDNTKDISTLGTYTLDNNSLYVNGYHEPAPSSPPFVATTPNLQTKPFDFNVTFIITNLVPTASLLSSSSALSRSASIIITHQLNNSFMNSNINRTFSGCKVLSFSPANASSTNVYSVCTFGNDSSPLDVNKVTVYREFRDNTKDISTLGTYALDNNTPFVATTPNLQTKPFDFNVTFIITNLVPTASLLSSSSALSRSASIIIAYQLNNSFMNSNINRTFSGCKVLSFSPTNASSTNVYSVCTFGNDSSPQDVNKVTVYREFRDNTKDISTLGTYTLDNNTPFVATSPNLQTSPFDFNVTFSITNLIPTASLQSSSSALFKSASIIIAYQLNNSFMNSNINRTFSGCKVLSFSPANASSTNVYSVCTFGNDSSPQDVNKVTVYREFRDNTKDISILGTYTLDNNTPFVATTPNLQTKPFDFNVTFIITNLVPTASLLSSSSALFNSASIIIAYQLNNSFRNSNINRTFSGCKVLSFRSANVDSTSVYSICTFGNDSTPQEVNNVTVYHEFKDNTKDISTLGTYSLYSNSLYVNGYHESAPLVTEAPIVVVTLQPNERTKPSDFNVTFTVDNLAFTPNLQNLNSPEYTTASGNIISSLNNLYRNSKIKETFTNCELVSFSPANQGSTKVETRCSFKNNLTTPEIDKVTAYNEFRDNTAKISALGPYALNKNSLYVNGYQELETTTTPTIPLPLVREGDLLFELNFTIINRNFTEALNDPNSPEYRRISANVTKMLEELYRKSSLKDSYRICKVTGLRIGSVKVICNCYIDPTAASEAVTAEQVKTEFATGTNGTNLLGNTYQLRSNSLAVEAKAPVSTDNIEIPYWGILLIVLGILIVLFLIFVFGLLIALCLKKKYHGSYNTLQNPAGTYLPHQKYY
ncbi:hypothetical protein scyTo_0011009 [Scyliorhinus torazame]|uniref:SEA domain-containing protein n=1 Tax=Scyliorhinus torazame TaxID=75743 RepID=A0A401NG15_SCYTO|nr:hypothetical protein [Scyliorhinus torazame]